MADKHYDIPNKPVYRREVREIQNTDPVNAGDILNPVLRQLLENIAAVKELADSALKLAEPRRIGNASFDGTEDISLEQMGAAAAGHTHPVQTDVTGNAGTANKLKNARKIGNASFDGSADITLAQIGAAASGHTHTAQTAVSGNAGTATKLQTARKIGNASFDGSADITLAQIGAAASGHTHPVQTDVTGNAGTAAKLKTARKINGMNFDGSADRANYGSCSTAAGTAAKTVDCSGFALAAGAEITVKFTATNTAANPTLNVGGTGAKPVYYRGAAIPAGYLAANRTYTFRYNGTQYELVGDINTDTNTTYGNMKAATASAAGGAGLVPAPAAGAQGKYLRGDGTWQTPTDTKYTHPTTAGNKHIPSGGSSGKILKWSSDGTAAWGDEAKAVTGTFSVSGPAGWTPDVPSAGLYQYTLAGSAIPGLTAKHRIDLDAGYTVLQNLKAPIQAVNDNGTCKLITSEVLESPVTLQYTLIPTA